MEPEELAAAIKRLTAWAEEHAPEPEPELRERLRAHFDADPTELPIVTRALQAWDRPNFQVAIDAYLAGRNSELVGLATMPGVEIGLAELAGAGGWYDSAISSRAPEHVTLPLGEDESITCVQLGLWLVADDSGRLAIMLASSNRGMGEDLALEVMSDERARAETVAERLRASGRHMRRGLLLHGPPGVGKTLTAMYLAAQMRDRTVVLLTGQGLGTVTTSVDLATALAPSIVILEDVDLVAMERSFEPTNAILFELLNAMDGLDADHDVCSCSRRTRRSASSPPSRRDRAGSTRPSSCRCPIPTGGDGSWRSTARASTWRSTTTTSWSRRSTGRARRSSASCCGGARSSPPRNRPTGRCASPSATCARRSRSCVPVQAS